MSDTQEREFSCVMRQADKAGHPDLCCCKAVDEEGDYEDLCLETSAFEADDCGCCC
ncbi:MAG: hypothetical protein HY911_10180 [Desulfobacterales bacterium]|nr:hypothetical protein [Desulfobacterales bacterium]